MKPVLSVLCSLIVATGLMLAPTQAASIIGASGENSTAGVGPGIIAAPFDILDDCVTNLGMQGFDEAQGVVTTVPHATDSGVIPAVGFVNSHMIFLNSGGGHLRHNGVTWKFTNPIIGVMSDASGSLEAASTFELGAPWTNYLLPDPLFTSCLTNGGTGDRAAPFGARGIENPPADCSGTSLADGYTVAGNSITVCLNVEQPGDWIRVVTQPQPVKIYHKPGSNPNCERVNRGKTAVAVFGSDVFDVTTIDETSLSFGGATPTTCSFEDALMEGPGPGQFSQDGFLDLLCHFRGYEVASAPTDAADCVVIALTGRLLDGTEIAGVDHWCRPGGATCNAGTPLPLP